MTHPLPPNHIFYRVTTRGRRWRDVLSGGGSLYLPPGGNRYNVVLQRAAYVCDELSVTVTEFAYYAARNWQDRLGNHHIVAWETLGTCFIVYKRCFRCVKHREGVGGNATQRSTHFGPSSWPSGVTGSHS